jgi:hypothetical protein
LTEVEVLDRSVSAELERLKLSEAELESVRRRLEERIEHGDADGRMGIEECISEIEKRLSVTKENRSSLRLAQSRLRSLSTMKDQN